MREHGLIEKLALMRESRPAIDWQSPGPGRGWSSIHDDFKNREI
jgi:hypothetical protein